MAETFNKKRNRKSKNALYFFAMTAVAAAACVFIIKEGRRIKKENELLAYEVW